eukprot:167399_1
MGDPSDWEKASAFWWSHWIMTIIAAFFLSIVDVIHCKNIISDLYTKSRSSLSHRESLPQITLEYKLLSWFSLFAIVLFTTRLQLDWIMGLRIIPRFYCESITISLADIWFSAKLFMYLVFLLRLDMVYKSSSYAYKRKYLITVAIIIIIVILTANIFHVLTSKMSKNLVFIYNEIGVICHPFFNKFVISSILFLEFCASFGFIAAFLYPLIKNINYIKQTQDGDTYIGDRLVQIGLKATILTTTASISSMIMLTFLQITYFSYFLVKMDEVINSICIILMTAYYADSKYYKKLCCGMLWCCNLCGISDINKSKTGTSISIKLTTLTETNTTN